MQTLAILGRQPAIGLAELESLLGTNTVTPVGTDAALLDSSDVVFSRLGGTVKLAKVLTMLGTTSWPAIQDYLVKTTPEHTAKLPDGKLTLGLSAYGLRVNPKQLLATGLSIKKSVRSAGRPVRLVPNPEIALSSAQVLHNRLTSEHGWELIMIRHGEQTILAQTTHAQDIDAYAARDQGRPKRDARVGMLPPKLAQIIINLATANAPQRGTTVLDPFCGTGVVLQEALIMGYHVVGTDLEPRMITYTAENLEWLSTQRAYPHVTDEYIRELSAGDAITTSWNDLGISTIACETYLGQPFSAEPRPEKLRQVMQDVDTIHRKFLRNVARQTQPGFRLCVAVPAWHTTSGVKHLEVLENLSELGYTRIEFAHARADKLIYHREGQVVGRELVVLVRK